jgi:type VI secretion system secreted protein VgrG
MARNFSAAFEIDGVAANRVVRFSESHRLGKPPELHIELRYNMQVPTVNMVGCPAVLTAGFGDAEPRKFIGIVEEASVIGSSITGDGVHAYELKVVPRLGLLARSTSCQIFQEQNVEQIITSVLDAHGVSDYEWRLSGEHPEHVYRVQYQESALAFISRLCEQEGIYFFVEPDGDKEKVIFADDNSRSKPILGDETLLVRGLTNMDAPGDYALVPHDTVRVRSGKFSLRDYNHEKPKLDMTAEVEAKLDTELEVYDYPGEYSEPDQGKALAQIKLEAEQAWRNTVKIVASCPRVTVGRSLKLADTADLDDEYFVVAARHEFQDVGHESGGAPMDLKVSATLIPKTIPYRSRLTTPRPVIHGPQTARVVAPTGSETETIHTDEQGRCKVKFHWDRSDVQDDKASCWMRVSQMQTSGSLVLPRVDWEVVVEFLEGNPDRPVITGRLYNGVFMPPYALPEGKSRTSLQSASTPGGGGSNEIRFEDKAGSEEIMIHAQHDMVMKTANNKSKTVGNNETINVAVDSSLSVGADQTVKITKGNQNTIGADQTISVGGNRTVEVNAVTGLTVHGSATSSIGGNQFEMDGNPLEGLLTLAAQKVQEFLEAKAGEAIATIEGHVQGAVDQALGPINDLTGQAEAMGNNMQALADGDMSAISGMVGDASGIPGAGDFARSLGGDDGGEGGGVSGGPLGDVVAGGNMITAAANNAVQASSVAASGAANQAISGGVGAAHNALRSALGFDAQGGGGESGANVGGPEGSVDAVDGTDRTKGPGHAIRKIAGNHSETVGSVKVLAALDGLNTNVAGNMTQDAGLAHLEVIAGDRAESIGGDKTEKALGLVVLSKGGESEKVAGARTTMVGGAIIDKHKGSHEIEAGGPATFVGAFHKYDAKGKITLKCGASTVVLDGGGLTITTPALAIAGAKIQLTKKVTEN